MNPYHPEQPPLECTPEKLGDYIYKQLLRIALSLQTVNDIDKTYSAPDKVQPGMIRYADGTGWDPGSGAGLYYWNGSAWTLIA